MFLVLSPDRHPIPSDLEPIPARELREFIAGNDPPVDAEPAFREQLRERLWTMLSAQQAERTTAG
jgi:hypothetical protein